MELGMHCPFIWNIPPIILFLPKASWFMLQFKSHLGKWYLPCYIPNHKHIHESSIIAIIRICNYTLLLWASLVAQTVKNLPPTQETWIQFLDKKIPWRREWLPSPVFFLGDFQTWGHKESDKTNALIFMIIIIHLMSYSLLDCNLHKGRNRLWLYFTALWLTLSL